MKRFTDAGRQAIADKNLYAALTLALAIPDICGSLEDPGPNKSKARYVRWCKQWLEPMYTLTHPGNGAEAILSAENCYAVRCSMIHSGQSDLAEGVSGKPFKLEFFDGTAGAHMNRVGEIFVDGVSKGGLLQLKADRFSADVFNAADDWDVAMATNQVVQTEKAKLLTIHSSGAAVFGGAITFG